MPSACRLSQTLGGMKHPLPKRPPILERRSMKRGAKESEKVRAREHERAKEQRELAEKHVLVSPENLAPDNSYGTPDFVERGYYIDMPFNCKSCSVAQVWTDTQQKWWYEVAKGSVWAVAVLCRPCRRKEQMRRAAARDVHLGGIAAKGRNAA
jgi:hypothetical protein